MFKAGARGIQDEVKCHTKRRDSTDLLVKLAEYGNLYLANTAMILLPIAPVPLGDAELLVVSSWLMSS